MHQDQAGPVHQWHLRGYFLALGSTVGPHLLPHPHSAAAGELHGARAFPLHITGGLPWGPCEEPEPYLKSRLAAKPLIGHTGCESTFIADPQ